ncbi:lysine biosynthesis protein LysX [Candidatus Bathyarchaeota archaeon]|nr:lysine biosynthesis protein LysX [Candidatus Bathyarchaeota archaeon]
MGLLYDQLRPDERLIIEAAKRKNVDLELYDTNSIPFDVTTKGDGLNADVFLQRCISYFRAVHIAATLESVGKTVVNTYNVMSICGNKLMSSLRLRQAGIPTPDTMLAFSEEAAISALNKLGYPAIIKPVVGSWGRLVAQINDPTTARSLIEAREYMHPLQQVYYLQQKIKRPNRDIRCYVIGDEAVAAIYRNAPAEDWRTNTALGGYAESCKIDSELAELSVKAAQAVGGGAFGVDLMETDNGLVVHEVNHTTEFKNTVKATGVDIPGKILDYAESQAKK